MVIRQGAVLKPISDVEMKSNIAGRSPSGTPIEIVSKVIL
jgi:hypothetical protein